jgi:acyl-CoA oxidase
MIGCYAQTELGHGSNVRALETTATFQPQDKGGLPGGSWVIHSPTLTSYKFWPGTLGRTANHAMVIAKLIDGKGVDRGIHNFLVPLRSMKDHTLLPGVKTGDIGPKIGYNVMDNGFASFDKVIIPRRNMAMRFAHVDEFGNYQKKTLSDAAQRISYITMMQVRAYICNEAGKNLAMACTITTRYSAVRRQGFSADGKSELQVLDYKQQQHRIFPLIAASYCFFFTGKKLLNRLFDMERRLVANIPVSKLEVTDIHASSSGLKSFTTMVTADGIEDCRKACGGHGFLTCSGLPELLTTYLQNPTVEGDNHMLPQQVVKVLLKVVQAVQKSDGSLSGYDICDSSLLIPSIESIIRGRRETCAVQSQTDLMNLKLHIMAAFRHRAAHLLVQVAHQLKSDVKDGRTEQEAWNNSLVLMARVSRAYSQLLLLRNFIEGIDEEETKDVLGAPESSVLHDLARLFALYWMERELGDFLEDGYMTARQASLVHSSVLSMLDTVRPNAVALVDARDFSDFRLKSALGRFDGDVYPAIMEAAIRDPLNQTEPGPGYKEHLKRLTAEGSGIYTGTASRL